MKQKLFLTLLIVFLSLTGCRNSSEFAVDDLPEVKGWNIEKVAFLYDFNPTTMQFSDRLHGFATGRLGGKFTVLHTEDAGNTWQPQFPDTPFYLGSLFVLDESVAFLAGEDGDFFRTNDGGKHWIKRPHDGLGYLMNMHFSDPNNGIGKVMTINPSTNLADYALMRTTDAGETWSPTGANVRQYQTGQIAFAGGVYYLPGENATLLKSTDLGVTWQSLPLQLNPYDEVMGLQFVDANNGFLGFGYRNLKTTDGGATWTEFEFPFYSIGQAHFVNLQEGLGFEDRWDDNGKRPGGDYVGRLFSTSDGWQTWDASEYSKALKYSGASFPEPNVGFLMGYGSFYRIFKN